MEITSFCFASWLFSFLIVLSPHVSPYLGSIKMYFICLLLIFKKQVILSSTKKKWPVFCWEQEYCMFVFYFCVPEIILLLMLWLVVFSKVFPVWVSHHLKTFISRGIPFLKRFIFFFYFYRSCIKYYKQNPLDEQHIFQLPVRPTAVKNLYQRYTIE